MFIPKVERKIASFNLDDARARDNYGDLISDPAVTVLSKRFATQTETNFEGESQSTISQMYVYVEYEECSI